MDILDLTYAEYLYEQEQKRIEEQEKLFSYYIGNRDAILRYLKTALEVSYPADEIEEMQLNFINVTEKIINQLAIVYREPAEYQIIRNGKEDDGLTEYYYELLTEDQHVKKKLAHRYAKLLNTSLTRVKFDKEKSKIDLIVEPSHIYVVETDEEDKKKLKKVLYDKYYKRKGKDELFKVVWTEEDHYKLDALGNVISINGNEQKVNPYKPYLPYASLRLKPSEGFWGEGLHDIGLVNEMINFLLTVLVNEGIVMGTAGTTLAINLGLEKKVKDKETPRRVRTGKRHPISVNMDRNDIPAPSLQHVTTEPYIIEIRDTIDWYIKTIALSKGLNPNSFLQGVQATSGYSKIIDSLEQLEIRKDDLEACRNYERDLFEVIKKINNTHKENRDGSKLKTIPDDAELLVDFAEISIPKTQAEINEERQNKLDMNLTNYAEIMMEENPDLDEDTAIEKIKHNKEINQLVKGNLLQNIIRGNNAGQQRAE